MNLLKIFNIEKNDQIKERINSCLDDSNLIKEEIEINSNFCHDELIGYRNLCAPAKIILKRIYYESQLMLNFDRFVSKWPLLGGLFTHWELRPTLNLPISKNQLLTFLPIPCRKLKLQDYINIENIDYIIDKDEDFVGIEHIFFNSDVTLWKDEKLMFAVKTKLNMQDPLDCYEDASEFSVSDINLGGEYRFNSTTLISILTKENMRNLNFSLWKRFFTSLEVCGDIEIPFLYGQLLFSLGSRINITPSISLQGVVKKTHRQNWDFYSKLDMQIKRWFTLSISLLSTVTPDEGLKIQIPSIRLEIEL